MGNAKINTQNSQPTDVIAHLTFILMLYKKQLKLVRKVLYFTFILRVYEV